MKGRKTEHGGTLWWIETNYVNGYGVAAWQCDHRYWFTTCNHIKKSGFKSEQAAVDWIVEQVEEKSRG